jgi:hypothetical protein
MKFGKPYLRSKMVKLFFDFEPYDLANGKE